MLPRDPVPVDAIPDIGENQQIVFTEWTGRSPQDVEDQITYPLTVSLLGVPGVKTVRSYSIFGFSTIYVIFKRDVDFYWARSPRAGEAQRGPEDAARGRRRPRSGPDATALGQVFWYTLEGRDPKTASRPAAGTWTNCGASRTGTSATRLQSAEGVSEVASVGGFVREYQVDVDPDAMRAAGVTLPRSSTPCGSRTSTSAPRTIEINRVEYVIRGLGFIKSVADIENTVVKSNDNVPIYLKNVAHVATGPGPAPRGAGQGRRRGGRRRGRRPLRREPAGRHQERQGEDRRDRPGLPKKMLADGRVSQVTIVPFYDRTGLIHETLGTLETALGRGDPRHDHRRARHGHAPPQQRAHLGLAAAGGADGFIAMKLFGVDANIVSLSGIAIAIGTMVDMGIIICENILRHLDEAAPDESRLEVVFRAASEVGRPVLTAILDHRRQLPAGLHDGRGRGQAVQAAGLHQDVRA